MPTISEVRQRIESIRQAYATQRAQVESRKRQLPIQTQARLRAGDLRSLRERRAIQEQRSRLEEVKAEIEKREKQFETSFVQPIQKKISRAIKKYEGRRSRIVDVPSGDVSGVKYIPTYGGAPPPQYKTEINIEAYKLVNGKRVYDPVETARQMKLAGAKPSDYSNVKVNIPLEDYQLSISEQERQQELVNRFIDKPSQIAKAKGFPARAVYGSATGFGLGGFLAKQVYGAGSETVGVLHRVGLGKKEATKQIKERPLETVSAGINVALPVSSRAISLIRAPSSIKFIAGQTDDITKGIIAVESKGGKLLNRLFYAQDLPQTIKPTYYKFVGKQLKKIGDFDVTASITGNKKVIEPSISIAKQLFQADLKNIGYYTKDVGITKTYTTPSKYSAFESATLDVGRVAKTKGSVLIPKGKYDYERIPYSGFLVKGVGDVARGVSSVGQQIAKTVVKQTAPIITRAKKGFEIIPKVRAYPETTIKPIKVTTPKPRPTTKPVPKDWMGVYDVGSVADYGSPKQMQNSLLSVKSMLGLREVRGIKASDLQTPKQMPSYADSLMQQQRRRQVSKEAVRRDFRSLFRSDYLMQTKQATKQTPAQRYRTPIPRPRPAVPVAKTPYPKPSVASSQTGLKKFAKEYSKAYQLLVKRAGKYQKEGVFTRGEALKRGEALTLSELSASFKLEPTKQYVRGIDKPYKISDVFRTYKIHKGKKIPLLDEFIQKKGYRLSSRGEVQAIQRARRRKKK